MTPGRMPLTIATADDARQPPNCWRCRFFRITHQRATPYGCDAMGFQSQILPCIEVLRTDGSPCMSFARKPVASTASSWSA